MSFKLTKQSMLTGKIHEMVLPVDGDKLLAWMRKPKGQRQLIQDEFPELDADQREFIMTGATKEEWDAIFGDEDGEEAA